MAGLNLSINKMQQAGKISAMILDKIGDYIKPGISTGELDKICVDLIKGFRCSSSALGYYGYPKSVCISPNDVVCHGIPTNNVILNEGDIVNIDVVINYNGHHGDSSRMFFVGQVSHEDKELVRVTYNAMMRGIAASYPGCRVGDIGQAIEDYVKEHKYSIVKEYCGHGIGHKMHQPPNILHYGRAGTGAIITPGMAFTVEPMINAGNEQVKVEKDGWTVKTLDGKKSAQFEHTVYMTEEGPQILTFSQNNTAIPY